MFVSEKNGFTLIELLVVAAIITVLATITVMIVNPTEHLRKARDTHRVADINSLDTAINSVLYSNKRAVSLGTASTVYVSVPDISSTCANLNLPSLGVGWSYHCVASSTLASIDGTGWIPINFETYSQKIISALPIDPTNNATSSLYYAYVINDPDFELDTWMESDSYNNGGAQDVVSTDGGNSTSTYEKGNDLTLYPL